MIYVIMEFSQLCPSRLRLPTFHTLPTHIIHIPNLFHTNHIVIYVCDHVNSHSQYLSPSKLPTFHTLPTNVIPSPNLSYFNFTQVILSTLSILSMNAIKIVTFTNSTLLVLCSNTKYRMKIVTHSRFGWATCT